MALNLNRLSDIFRDQERMLTTLQRWKLVPEEGQYSCPRCSHWLQLRRYSSSGRATLLEVIKEWIHLGTTILSDYWKAYDCLNEEGYKHLKVNHSLQFKDPETGAHTNNIEASWRAAKAITTSADRKKAHVPSIEGKMSIVCTFCRLYILPSIILGNLAKYMFNKVCAIKNVDRTEEFFRLAGLYFDPARNVPVVPDNEEDDQDTIEEADFDD